MPAVGEGLATLALRTGDEPPECVHDNRTPIVSTPNRVRRLTPSPISTPWTGVASQPRRDDPRRRSGQGALRQPSAFGLVVVPGVLRELAKMLGLFRVMLDVPAPADGCLMRDVPAPEATTSEPPNYSAAV
jgi:hypothetical protein